MEWVKDYFNQPETIYTVVVFLVMLLVFVVHMILKRYADEKTNKIVTQVMLAVEKWAKKHALDGESKRLKAITILVNKVYPKLPMYITLFVDKETLIEKIDTLYLEMLDYLDDGVNNDSIK